MGHSVPDDAGEEIHSGHSSHMANVQQDLHSWTGFHTPYTLFQSDNETMEVVSALEEQLLSHSYTSHEPIKSLFTAYK